MGTRIRELDGKLVKSNISEAEIYRLFAKMLPNETKKDKKANCTKILYKYPLGSPIKGQDLIYLVSVLSGHSEWNQKVGAGIDSITTIMPDGKWRCPYINRIDGTGTDISLNQAINPPKKETMIAKACRAAVKQEVQSIYDSINFGVDRCPFSGELLKRGQVHIDHHDLAFNELMEVWLVGKDIDLLYNDCNWVEDNNVDHYFKTQSIAEDFRAFHNANTHLRALSKAGHKERTRIQRGKKKG